MTFNKRTIPALGSIAAMLILILDSKTALAGVSEGIDLCLKVVIPSLFPFLILSTLLTESTYGMKLWFLRPLCRLCRIPNEAAPLLLVGLIGGYPVGAQCIARSWRNGQLSDSNAQRMLGFCSNAGPGFIFGMTAGLFDSMVLGWILWLIQIVAILITGCLLPGNGYGASVCSRNKPLSPAVLLHQAISAMTSICGWVILFRTVITFCDRHLLHLLPQYAQCLTAGILELTNGCCRLIQVPSEKVRLLLCSIFLSFGGIGVYMQTVSVTQGLGTGSYLKGKILQTGISAVLAMLISLILFPSEPSNLCAAVLISAVLTIALLIKFLHIKKNNSRNPML